MSDKVESETDRVLSCQVAQNLMQRVVEKLRAKAKSPGAPVEDFAVDEIAA
jgi:hypothetical protein